MLKEICLVITKDESSGAWMLALKNNTQEPMGCANENFDLSSYEKVDYVTESNVLENMPD